MKTLEKKWNMKKKKVEKKGKYEKQRKTYSSSKRRRGGKKCSYERREIKDVGEEIKDEK